MSTPTPPTSYPRGGLVRLLAVLFAAVLPLLHAQSATGTATLTGRVQNEVTGQYLNNARVSVRGTDQTAFTD